MYHAPHRPNFGKPALKTNNIYYNGNQRRTGPTTCGQKYYEPPLATGIIHKPHSEHVHAGEWMRLQGNAASDPGVRHPTAENTQLACFQLDSLIA